MMHVSTAQIGTILTPAQSSYSFPIEKSGNICSNKRYVKKGETFFNDAMWASTLYLWPNKGKQDGAPRVLLTPGSWLHTSDVLKLLADDRHLTLYGFSFFELYNKRITSSFYYKTIIMAYSIPIIFLSTTSTFHVDMSIKSIHTL